MQDHVVADVIAGSSRFCETCRKPDGDDFVAVCGKLGGDDAAASCEKPENPPTLCVSAF